MDQNVLINEASELLKAAADYRNKGFAVDAMTNLAKLRELLNNQPDLEAGGATETPPAAEPES